MEITHELKIRPEYFYALMTGQKRFEIRKADRDYKVGDTLRLNCFDGKKYTGESLTVKVTYILNGTEETEEFGLMRGYCIMSIL